MLKRCATGLWKGIATAVETIDEEPTKAESMLKRCATGLWKGIAAAGKVAACVALTVGVTVSMVPVFDLVDAAVDLLHTLEGIQHDLRAKDKKITENARLLARKNCDLQEHYVTIQDLQQKRKQLEARLKCRQQEQRNLHKETAVETIEVEPTKAESMFKQCATGLWKGIAAAGKVAACVALTVGVTVSIVPVFDLVDTAVDLLM
ncbi:hypothetical protein D5F01_LYC15987 [Larimichthys crocea]|uniref:Uncharacterized protein n=1 Tax=Larimichthys crocea TaxID=215358 RepID=A0A6G0I4X6_LARCR|nr:hypothetical protein D5F01_LYC15987 [Larimichthys crocea]